ncbi:MerR family DNA-binding transcriptional regulator [Kibdelosporangium aridum]|uniref:MerR family DNA-binding transcriptional regulator n=1 Tax=Kibdelosporangium aridum TaxID=2030 RepID=A0A428YWQ5_KIBAR|nr:MerR family transcriptional regulator [Kibdelosporangium aridum]RSM74601.1 MerR family DNA-binding transcriptional regulator [Kibdelosporangium aridum]
MRMAELSRRTGVPVPTIKYYLREGLLLPGERTSPNQAIYDETHIRRLRMIRALTEVGGLSIAKVRDVLDAVDSPEIPFEVLGTVQHSIEPPSGGTGSEYWETARERVAKLLLDRGWRANIDGPPAKTLIAALASLYELGREDLAGLLERYAPAAEKIAEFDVAAVTRDRGIEDTIEGVVIGTVLGDVMLGALRRLAHQHATAKALGLPENYDYEKGSGGEHE